MAPEVHHNPYHLSIVRSQLTRNLGALYPEIRDEIITAFDDVLDLEGNGKHLVPISMPYSQMYGIPIEWKNVPALSSVEKVVCRTSNRVFVGLPLCKSCHCFLFHLFLLEFL